MFEGLFPCKIKYNETYLLVEAPRGWQNPYWTNWGWCSSLKEGGDVQTHYPFFPLSFIFRLAEPAVSETSVNPYGALVGLRPVRLCSLAKFENNQWWIAAEVITWYQRFKTGVTLYELVQSVCLSCLKHDRLCLMSRCYIQFSDHKEVAFHRSLC